MNSKSNNSSNSFTVTHRILHWTIALLMFVLFITGFLRMYWMSKKTIIGAVEQNLPDITLTKEQIMGIAKGIIKPMWEWHEYAAYVLAFAFAIRIVYMIWKKIKFPNPFNNNNPSKERLQGVTYFVFYLFIFISIVTGFYLEWGSDSLKEPMEEIHKWAIYWFPIFFIMHIVGIGIGELTDKKGVVSKMIGGD